MRVILALCVSHAGPILGLFLVGLATMQTCAIALSLLGISISQPVAIAIIAIGLAAGTVYGRRLVKSGLLDHVVPREISLAVAAPVWLLALVYAVLFVAAVSKPDLTWDGNWYHIPTINEWALEDAVHWVRKPDERMWDVVPADICNGLPKGAELIGFVLIRATGFDGLLNAINFAFLPIGFLSILYFCRCLSCSASLSIFAAAAYGFIPINLLQSTTTYVDAATCAIFVAVFLLSAMLAAEAIRGRLLWALVPALGCAMGLALSVKGTGVLVLLAAIGLLCASLALRWREEAWSLSYLRSAGVFVGGIAILASIVGGYWSIRNYVYGGSPLYPGGVFLLGREIFPGQTLAEQLPMSACIPAGTETWAQWKRIGYTWLQGLPLGRWPMSLRVYDSRDGGWGFFWLLGCLPALAILLAGFITSLRRSRSEWGRRDTHAVYAFAFLFITMCAVYIAYPWNHWSRYTLWIYGLGIPAFVYCVHCALKSERRWIRAIARGWVAICLFVMAFEGVYAAAWTATRTSLAQQGWPAFAQNPMRAAKSIWWHDPAGYLYPVLTDTLFETMLSEPGTVAFAGEGHPYGKYLLGQVSQPVGFRRVVGMPDETAANTEEARRFIDTFDVRYLIVNRAVLDCAQLRPFALRHETIGADFLEVMEFSND